MGKSVKFCSARGFREQYADLIAEVQSGTTFILTSYGKPVATVSPIDESQLSIKQVKEL